MDNNNESFFENGTLSMNETSHQKLRNAKQNKKPKNISDFVHYRIWVLGFRLEEICRRKCGLVSFQFSNSKNFYYKVYHSSASIYIYQKW